MKITIVTEDELEAKRLLKANDMAMFICELVHNGYRQFKNIEYDYEPAWEKINKLLEEYNIDINDLIE